MEESRDTWNLTKSLAEGIILQGNSVFEDRPCDENDFTEIKPHIEERLFNLLNQIKNHSVLCTENCHPDLKISIVYTLLACGEHAEKNKWTSDRTIQLSEEIQNVVFNLCNCQKIKQVICSLFKQCLSILRTKLVRDLWRQYPASVASFRWILLQVEMPQLGEHMSEVFPATLLILDDFDMDNKILGCVLMHHIVTNVTRAEMRRQQYDDVVYDVLQRLMYQRDAELVLPVVTCLSTLLTRMDSSFTQCLEMRRFDQSLQVLLGQMEMEQGLALRQAYAASLPLMLSAGGLSLVRWSQKLLRVVAEYLSIEDASQGQTQVHTLQALHTLLVQTWPRIPSLASQVLTSLLKLLIDVTQVEGTLVLSEEKKKEILDLIEKCLILVAIAAPDKCLQLLSGSQTLPCTPQFHEIINKIQENCQEKQ